MLLIDERVEIQAGSHTLRGVLCYPKSEPVWLRVLVQCPHPFLGGTPDNPVVRALIEGIAAGGGVALAWEYRAQDGSVPEEEIAQRRAAFFRDHHIATSTADDLQDAKICLDWLRAQNLGDWIMGEAVAGYSYGGALALLLAGTETSAFAISPPLRALPDDWRIRNLRAELLVAEDDFSVSSSEIEELEQRSPVSFAHRTTLTGTDHFFLDRLDEIRECTTRWTRAQFEQCVSRTQGDSLSIPHASNLL